MQGLWGVVGAEEDEEVEEMEEDEVDEDGGERLDEGDELAQNVLPTDCCCCCCCVVVATGLAGRVSLRMFLFWSMI